MNDDLFAVYTCKFDEARDRTNSFEQCILNLNREKQASAEKRNSFVIKLPVQHKRADTMATLSVKDQQKMGLTRKQPRSKPVYQIKKALLGLQVSNYQPSNGMFKN